MIVLRRDYLLVIVIIYSIYGFVLHTYTHLDRNLKSTDIDISTSVEYVTSIIVFPILILAITAFFCFLFLIALLCRCCVRSFIFCCLKRNNETTNIEEKIKRRRTFEIVMIILLFSAACSDAIIFLGNSKATKAFLDIANAISILIDWLNSFTPLIKDILQHIILSTRVVLSSSCAGYSNSLIIDNLSYINSATDSMHSFVDTIIGPLKNLEDAIRGTGMEKKDLVIITYLFWLL